MLEYQGLIRIKNIDELLNNACDEAMRKAREILLESLVVGLNTIHPKNIVEGRIQIAERELAIIDAWDEKHKFGVDSQIYLIGFGKYSSVFAEFLEQKIDIIEGIVIDSEKYGGGSPKRVKVLYGDHPVPGRRTLESSSRLLDFIESIPKDSTVIAIVMGGASALFEIPMRGLDMDLVSETVALMLRAGLDIYEINTVRKHLSLVKGGNLAKHLYPRKTIALIISDVPGDNPSFIGSGPLTPDPTTFEDAKRILNTYGLWEKIDKKVKQIIELGIKGRIEETPKPKDRVFEKTKNIIVANNMMALKTIRHYLKMRNLNPILLTDKIGGEARDVGKNLIHILAEFDKNNNTKPIALIAGGETRVTIRGKGIGGRNQELALASAIAMLKYKHKLALVAIGTDGIDNVPVAGALADTYTISRARDYGLDPNYYLYNNDSYTFFSKLLDTIITGKTGTNVADIIIGIKISN